MNYDLIAPGLFQCITMNSGVAANFVFRLDDVKTYGEVSGETSVIIGKTGVKFNDGTMLMIEVPFGSFNQIFLSYVAKQSHTLVTSQS